MADVSDCLGEPPAALHGDSRHNTLLAGQGTLPHLKEDQGVSWDPVIPDHRLARE